jgi:hypothetical protein
VQQYKAFGFGSAMAGIPLFFLVYMLLLLPVFLSLGRLMLEAHAVYANWKEAKQLDLSFDNLAMITADDVKTWPEKLWSKTYLWAVPKTISRALFTHLRYKFLKKYGGAK